MQQIKKIHWVFQVQRMWPIKSGTSLLPGQQNCRGVKCDSLEKQRHSFVEHMQKLLPLSYEQGTKIFNEVPALRSNNRMISMEPNIEFLLTKNITLESIVENPFLLLMKRGKHAFKEYSWPSVGLTFIFTFAKRLWNENWECYGKCAQKM